MGGDLGVVIEDLGGEAQLLTAVRQRLALLPGQCHGYRLEAVAEQLGSFMEDARAFGDRRFRPGRKGRGGGAQRPVGVPRIAEGHVADDFAGGGVVNRSPLAVDCLNPPATDQQVGAQPAQAGPLNRTHREASRRQSSA